MSNGSIDFNGGEKELYAIVETGGKQYRVGPGDELEVEKLPGKVGDRVELKRVLMISENGKIKVGQPYLNDALVSGEILRQGKARKIIVFKKKRRKGYRRKRGHRQEITRIKIGEIKTGN